MTVLLSAQAIVERRSIACGTLAPLAASLRADLAPLLAAGAPWIPPEKAQLSRVGGRCPAHGTQLEFDPWSPRAHRCPDCGTVFQEEEHYRWWIMNYQLWLAERAVHAATLSALTDDAACARLATDILAAYAARYAQYPNRDNVLGPTRPFFSTYLESIWLLQLTVALDLLEAGDGPGALGAEVRERIIRPSAALIASYDEGLSNRQVYNNAALAAAGALLGEPSLLARAVAGPSGLEAHFARGLLADGTWYEGENYHLFAHRGLWYGVTIAEAHGHVLSSEGRRRFREAFATPFATALPDFTFPSRRDSQYRVSLRQWRMAESCELGLARGDDPRLISALAALYRPDDGAGASGRATSTAEAERNTPPVPLTRSSLGWKSLLFARESLPPLGGRVPASVHLAGQGLAVLRRDEARTFVALDYGESGGGHGHPDRLNFWLVVGESRILEDVGTGSYVDPTLHWYRSTLAHNAPLADGRSQWRATGVLTGYDERAGEKAGLVSARASIAPGVTVERTLVVMDDYVIDELRWTADRVITFDVPYHVDAEMANGGRWGSAVLAGGRGLEDGFDFIAGSEHLTGTPGRLFHAQVGDVRVRAWVDCDTPHEWWRCVAPGPPGDRRRRFLLLRSRARSGTARSVWSWKGTVSACAFDPGGISISRGAWERHDHRRDGDAWQVTRVRRSEQTVRRLGGALPACEGTTPRATAESSPSAGADLEPGANAATPSLALPVAAGIVPPLGEVAGSLTTLPATAVSAAAVEVTADAPEHAAPLRFPLGRAHYRRSEATWEDAGAPVATVGLLATPTHVVVEVAVRADTPTFAPALGDNPLDNEHPDINSDGVQLYVGAAQGAGRYYSWILVPEPAPVPAHEPASEAASEAAPARVRVTARAAFGPPLPLEASARLTPDGWVLRAAMPRAALVSGGAGDFTLDLIVNEISPDRARRRGQLVLSGGRDEWIYLRGDRQDAARALPFCLPE